MFRKSVAGLASLFLLGSGAGATEDGLPNNPDRGLNELQQVSTEMANHELGGGAAPSSTQEPGLVADQRAWEAEAWREYNQQEFLRHVWTDL